VKQVCLIFVMTGASGLGTLANGSVVLVLARRSASSVHYRRVQRDGGPLEDQSYTRGKGVKRGPKYRRKTLVGETPGHRKNGKGRLGVSKEKSQFNKWHVFRWE